NLSSTPATYTLSLHDALPICRFGTVHARGRFIEQQKFCPRGHCNGHAQQALLAIRQRPALLLGAMRETDEVKQLPNLILEVLLRSEEHTSELQSRENLVCRLL